MLTLPRAPLAAPHHPLRSAWHAIVAAALAGLGPADLPLAIRFAHRGVRVDGTDGSLRLLLRPAPNSAHAQPWTWGAALHAVCDGPCGVAC